MPHLGFLADNSIASTGAVSPERSEMGNRVCVLNRKGAGVKGWRAWPWAGPHARVGEILVIKKCSNLLTKVYLH